MLYSLQVFESLSKTCNALQHCRLRKKIIRNWVLNQNDFSRNIVSLQVGVANDQCNTTFMQAGHCIVVLVLMAGEPTSNIVVKSCHSSHSGATGFPYVKCSTFVTFHQRGRATHFVDRKPRTRHIWIAKTPPEGTGSSQCQNRSRWEVRKRRQGLRRNWCLWNSCSQRRNRPCQRLVRNRSHYP